MPKRGLATTVTALTAIAVVAALALHGVLVRHAIATPLLADLRLVDHIAVILDSALIGVATALGWVLSTRRPRNPIGWLLLASVCLIALGGAARAYARLAVLPQTVAFGPVELGAAGAPLAEWIGAWPRAVGVLLFLTFGLMLFPDGRLPSRAWRTLAATAVALVLLVPLAGLGVPGTKLHQPHPLYVSGLSFLNARLALLPDRPLPLLAVAAGIVVLLSASSVAVRHRQSSGDVRLQLRWVAFAGAVAALVNLVLLSTGAAGFGMPDLVEVAAPRLALLLIPLAVFAAIARYRLYDIDLIIRRSFVLSSVTLFVLACYVGAATAAARVSTAASPLSWVALFAAVGFGTPPVYERSARWGAQLVYGERALPHERLAAVTRDLQDVVSYDELPALVVAGFRRSIAASCVTLTLRGDAVPIATSPADCGARDGPPDAVVPIDHEGKRVGCVEVFLPSGDALTQRDRALLSALAREAAAALANLALIRDMSETVAKLETTTAALTRLNREILEDELAARDALRHALGLHVYPHLQVVGEALDRSESSLAEGDGDATAQTIESAAAAVDRALLELRSMARDLKSQPARHECPVHT